MPKKKTTEEKDTKKSEDKRKKSDKSVLDIALSSINKKHPAAIRWLSEVKENKIDFIPTGSISLDHALSGGFPRGRIVEVFGWESCGKSTLALAAASEANKLGLKILYIDCEIALDPRLAVSYGVDPDKFILEDSAVSAEEHLDILESAVMSGEIALAVIDSVSALTPKAVLEGRFEDAHVGLQARLMSQSLAKLVQLIKVTNTCLVFINQFREKVQKGGYGGDPRITSGGHSLPFYSTHRIEIAGSGKTRSRRILDKDGNIVGHKMAYKVVKNKLGLPFRSGDIDLIYGKGYDTAAELVDIATDFGVVNVSGAWFSYGGSVKVQGRDNFKELVMSDVELYDKLRSEVLSVLG